MDPFSADAPMLRALHKVTGYSSFRPTQLEAIHAVLQGRDVLLVLATGGGKSACFQVPALIKSQAVLVVSPTISLMKDQVSSLSQRGLAACLLGSASNEQERRGAYEGRYQFVYVTPEYLASRSMAELQELHSNCRFCCLAVDEAHCISSWGKGYRDSFLALSRMRAPTSPLKDVPWIAVTATASRAVQMEIAATLVLRSPLVICGSVERPNLHISVARKPSEDTGMAASMLMDLILGKPCRLLPHPQPFESDYSSSGGIRPTIIYCVSRSEVDQLCSLMNANERFQGKVAGYSAALSQEARAQAGQQFAEGELPVIIATTAFGLGVNKKDVRLVINWGPPGSLSMYMQMIGRAGRDLCPARCMMFWSPSGISNRKFMLRQDATSGNGNPAADSKEFDDLMKYVKMPTGCRHAFLSQTFSNDPQNAPGAHTLCHGGCDVCDLRVAAVRDLSCRFCRSILLHSTAGLVKPELLKRCMATPCNQGVVQAGAGNGYGQASTAVWLELAHEMLNMGLIQELSRVEGSEESEATARHVRITQAGEEELQRIQSVMQQQAQQSSAASAPQATPDPLTARMRTRRLATQALTLCSASASHQVAQQVTKGRKNLEDLCDDIDCSAQLPEAFRTLLPCVAWEPSICDLGPEVLKDHQVDIILWTCLKQCIILLARGASNLTYYDMKHSPDFISSKREWCRRANVTSAQERMQSALAEGQTQAVAVQKQQSKAKVSLALKKLGRKLEAEQRAQGESGVSGCMVLTRSDKIAAALPTSSEELAACGLTEEVVTIYGQQILDAIKGAPESASQSQSSQSILTQRPGGQENRSTVPAQRPSSASNVPADGGAKKREGSSGSSHAPNSVAARFSSKKRRT